MRHKAIEKEPTGAPPRAARSYSSEFSEVRLCSEFRVPVELSEILGADVAPRAPSWLLKPSMALQWARSAWAEGPPSRAEPLWPASYAESAASA